MAAADAIGLPATPSGGADGLILVTAPSPTCAGCAFDGGCDCPVDGVDVACGTDGRLIWIRATSATGRMEGAA